MTPPLVRVARTSKRYRDARRELEAAIRDAREDGSSLRVIAVAAGLTPETVRRISTTTATERTSTDG